MTERLVLGGAALLVGLLAGWMIRGVASYNPEANLSVAYDDWRVACPPASIKQAHCELVSDAVDPTTQNPLARVTVTLDQHDKPIIGFTMPSGVALEAGMGVQIGKDPLKVYQYNTCNTGGCIAMTPFDDKFSDAFKNADNTRVMFATLEGRPVGAPLSMKGYGTALKAYRHAEAERNSWFWRLWS
jgi:invasion protein IalB